MRVVVVDPSRTVLMAVSRLLATDGHHVTTFVDGPSALACIKADRSVDALITSAELTAMSGVELCWEARLLSGRDRAIYIILMSSNSEERHLVSALDSGADEFIRKPPAREELYARLRSAERLLRLQRELIRLAMIDPLTGVFNRRAFFEKAQQAAARAGAASPMAAIMFDVDHFKKVNDTHGHDVGDEVLRGVAREAADDRMIVGRLGGEEFAILIEETDLEAAAWLGENLRARIAALAFETAQGKLSLTCSFGISQWQAGDSIDRLLKRADSALYEAKGGGRNRVVQARSSTEAEDPHGTSVVRSAGRSTSASPSRAATPHSGEVVTWWANGPDAAPPAKPADGQLTCNAYVLDDEPQVGAMVCKVLEACSIASRQFTDPAPFLEQLKTAAPDLIVLDLSLGQSDAVEIIRHLEALRYTGQVLLISGRDQDTLDEIAQIGARHGLTMLPPLRKPFRPHDLKQRLATQAGQTSLAPKEVAPAKAQAF
jgi:two-component system cell cycle response regulator